MLKKIITVNGEPFILNKIKNKSLEPDIEFLKEITDSDTIVEDMHNYYFISTIDDAVVIKEEPKQLTASTTIQLPGYSSNYHSGN